MDMRFGTWNVRTRYRAGSLRAAAKELARNKLDLVGAQEVRWEKGGTVRAENLNFFLWKRRRKSSIETGVFVQHRILSADKRVEFVSDRGSYRILGGRWCNIIVLNEHAPSEEK